MNNPRKQNVNGANAKTERQNRNERANWIEVAGIPLHCWNPTTSRRIAVTWGSLEALGENMNQVLGCEKISMLISTSQQVKLEDLLKIVVGSEVFVVRVYEIRFLRIVSGKKETLSLVEMVKATVNLNSTT
ncbi:hypothetical protein V6N13_083450 [Hibiscus sabdariffa]